MAAGVNLWEVYTALLTERGDEEQINKAAKRPDRERSLESAVNLLNKHDRLILLGEAGSGKSTFVNFLVLCLTGERLNNPHANLKKLESPVPDDEGKPGKRQKWEHGDLLPIKIILRDLAASDHLPLKKRGTVEHLKKFLEAALTEWGIRASWPFVMQQIEDGRAILLFDGFDEISEKDRRAQACQIINECAARHGKCHILVTSRTTSQEHLALTGFSTAKLAQFADGQICWFVDRWYDYITTIKRRDSKTAKRYAASLKWAINHDARLREFARRPLLLTLMAALHEWKSGDLPKKLVELYHEITDLLLARWEREKFGVDAEGKLTIKQPSLSDMLKVGKDRILDALKRIAFEVHAAQTGTAGTADIPESLLVQRLYDASRNQEEVSQTRLMSYLSDRAGLIMRRSDHYTFPHRTFQEYLAACYLHDQEKFLMKTVKRAHEKPEQWQEVVLFAGQMSSPSQAWDLAEQLYQYKSADNRATKAHAHGAVFAARILKETGRLKKIRTDTNRRRKKRIRAWLKAILTEQTPKDAPLSALERAQAGDLLAAFGDNREGVNVTLSEVEGRDGSTPLTMTDKLLTMTGKLPKIEWVEIPEGEFWMGSDTTVDADSYEDEQPRHRVHVSAFWMSRYPVTNAQYQAFVEDGGYKKASYWEAGGGWEYKEKYDWTGPRPFDDPRFALANHPVVGVSWYEAMAFCAWLTSKKPSFFEKLGFSGVVRLPTEAEWEYAARGPGDAYRRYPWGNDDITPDRANYAETNIGATSAVGAFPRGRAAWMGGDGLEDLAGNVWEWCLHDRYDYAKGERTMREIGENIGKEKAKVVRGGAWCSLLRRPVRLSLREQSGPRGWRSRLSRCCLCGVDSLTLLFFLFSFSFFFFSLRSLRERKIFFEDDAIFLARKIAS